MRQIAPSRANKNKERAISISVIKDALKISIFVLYLTVSESNNRNTKPIPKEIEISIHASYFAIISAKGKIIKMRAERMEAKIILSAALFIKLYFKP